MSTDTTIEPLLRRIEPALRLIHERHLRQILYFFIDRGRILPTGTELPFWFTRADLEEADILTREVLHGTEGRLLLVTAPDDRMIADQSVPEQLRAYWRILFRAEVMKAIDARLAVGTLSAAACRARLDRLGPAAAREIRVVLESEELLAPGSADSEVYRTFAAVYLDFDYFSERNAAAYFPSLPDADEVRTILAEDVDAEAIFASSKPEGALGPEHRRSPEEVWGEAPAAAPLEPATTSGNVAALLNRADEAEHAGNLVRAAFLRTQASQALTGHDREQAVQGALACVRHLVDRLGDVLDWDTDTREEWRQALAPMLPAAASGEWPRAARCLYELQRIPAECAREVYAVELPEVIRTLGRRPLRRHLPHARPVMMLMAFRKAHKHLLRAGLGEPERLRFDGLLHHEIHCREHAIRHDFTPIVVDVLTNAGLVPANRAEEVARDKLVAELLDRICANGYLRIGDLRDAVARNQLKLPDLRGVGEFISGDPLLRADTGLAYALDGVYRRGEFYLRLIQRCVSVFFGTPWGRALTLYLALPFGGAFLTLMFAEELHHLGSAAYAFVARSASKHAPPSPIPAPVVLPPPVAGAAEGTTHLEWEFNEDDLEFTWERVPDALEFEPDEGGGAFVWQSEESRKNLASAATGLFTSSASQHSPQHPEHHSSFLIQWPTILGFGLFLLLVFHVPPFRRALVLLLCAVWRVIRGVLWETPGMAWRSRPVRAIRHSAAARYAYRRFATPLLLTLLVLGILFLSGLQLHLLLGWVGGVSFAALVVLYNFPFGWQLEDRIAEAIADWWRRVRVNFIPGLIGAILDAFRALMNLVERQLYAVDEWMRFRGGDSHGSLWVKAILGLVWFPIAYVTRFAFNLLLEPQVNPVKHFPVVTVSHKVIWPMVPQLASWTGLTTVQVGMFVNGIPGIFGFIAWELKEDWRLYAANRSARLPRATVGSHGESVRGLLRPGFHSGTVPKLYRKTRRAVERGKTAKVGLLQYELEHAAEGVHRFVERELVPLLAQSHDWRGVALEVAVVRFGVQRAEIALAAPSLGRDPFVLALENVGGVIEGSIARIGWADKITDTQRAVFVFALRGLLDMAAATRFQGRERTEEAVAEPDLGALVQPVAWTKWVERWGAQTPR